MPRARPTDADPDDDFDVEEDWEPAARSNEADELDDAAGSDDEDRDVDEDEDVSDTVPCPACGEAVYEHADFCPACRGAMVGGERLPSRRAWLVAAVLIGLTLVGTFLFL